MKSMLIMHANPLVRVRGGVPSVTDGPYLEAKEYFGGYYLVECASLGRALELAGVIPDAAVEGLGIEVRPAVFMAGGQEGSATVAAANTAD